jgi:hypothetical protein
MYQFSRAIYREVAGEISKAPDCANHAAVLRACEAAVERLASDRHYFARPARSLFNDVRMYFPMTSQQRVYRVIARYMAFAEEFLTRQPRQGYDLNGNPLQCRAQRLLPVTSAPRRDRGRRGAGRRLGSWAARCR